MRPRRFFAGGSLAVALALLFGAACGVGGGGGGGGSPTPTGSPTPVNPDSCQIVWISADATNSLLNDEFVVDAPIGDWTGGALNYTVNSPVGVFYDNYDPATKTAAAAGITTAGTFEITLANGTTPGFAVTFHDPSSSPQAFFAFDLVSGAVGAKIATNGTGDFTGVWTDPSAATPVGGTGSVVIGYQNSALTIGGLGSYAKCYHSAANLDRFQRIQQTLEEISPPRGAW